MAKIIVDRLRGRFAEQITASHDRLGNETVVLAPAVLVDAAKLLRGDPLLAMDMPIDCTAVDWWQRRTPRFEVIWHLYSTRLGHRLRLKVLLDDPDPSCASLTPIWPGMNWHEREAFDLYGIRFVGHPNLRRVLMYEEFVGHPLRKDYPIDRRQPLIPMQPPARMVPTQRQAPPEMLNRP